MKTRFCPSPTGHMHLGNARTALFSALYAIGHHGTFLLRIEDTDPVRSKEAYTTGLLADLHWLGITWQEGPDIGGEHGPYLQSQRQTIYDQYYEALIERGSAYSCFCTEQQLAITRKAQQAAGRPPRYPGTCRHLSAAEIAAKQAQGLTSTLRFHIPEHESITFMDGVKGLQQFSSHDIGDFVIRRADGTASFMYCNALDDALMNVSLVIRGEDHLTNTPRQIAILRSLGLPVPEYAHIALIAGDDGSPLSKRHGSQSVQQLRETGYLPVAINNYLGRVGHSYERHDLMSLSELATHFSTERLGKSAARFDASQLIFWQKAAVSQLDLSAFWTWVGEDIASMVPPEEREALFTAIQANVVFPVDVLSWIRCLQASALKYSDEVLKIMREAGASFFEVAKNIVLVHGADFDHLTRELAARFGLKGKALFMPLRAGLTGYVHGPEMKHIVELLGQSTTARRLEQVASLLC